MSRSLMKDEGGLTGALIRVILSIIMVSLIFIILNEVVLRIGNMSLQLATDPQSNTALLLWIWRIVPVCLLIFAVIYGIMAAVRERPSGVYG